MLDPLIENNVYGLNIKENIMKLKAITIKNMHKITRKTYNLGNISYFYGKNGAGKSTILQAIQLALLGYIPGYNKTNDSIFQHSNGSCMSVKLDFEDGYYIQRTYTKSKSSVTCDVVEDLPNNVNAKMMLSNLELPIFNFSELINQSANKLKGWFIDFLPKDSTAIDWKTLFNSDISNIPYDMSEFVQDTISNECFQLTGVEGILQVHTYLKALLSAKTADSKRAVNTLQSLIYNQDIEDCIESVESVQADIESLTNELYSNTQIESSYKQNLAIQKQLKQFESLAEYISRYEPYIEAMNTLEQLESQLPEFELKHHKIKELEVQCASLKKLLDTNGRCSYLDCECIKLQENLEDISTQYVSILNEIKSLRDQCEKYDKELSIAQRVKDSIDSQYISRDKLREQLIPISDDFNPTYIDTIRTKLQDKQELLGKVIANERYNSMVEQLNKDQSIMEFEIQCLKSWIKLTDANHLQNEYMKTPFIQLADKISTYLQTIFDDKKIKAEFNLSEKANGFSFGIFNIVDNVYIPYDLLSSGEKCLFALALMLSLIDVSNSNCKFILIDDMMDHLDDDRIEQLFKCFESNISDVQLIAAGVKPYTGDILSNSYNL